MLEYLCERAGGYEWHGTCRDGDGTNGHSALLWDPSRLTLRSGETRWLSPGIPGRSTIGWDAMYQRVFTRALFVTTLAICSCLHIAMRRPFLTD
jgi:hypothetical protein